MPYAGIQCSIKQLHEYIMAKTHKIGRDSESGKFIKVKQAKKRPKTTQVETIKYSPKKK